MIVADPSMDTIRDYIVAMVVLIDAMSDGRQPIQNCYRPKFNAGLLYESFGQGVLFPMSDHPSDDVSAEDIQDHIEIKVGPLHRPFEFGDIPGPDLVGTGGQQFGFFIMATLMPFSSLFDIAVNGSEDSVHGSD